MAKAKVKRDFTLLRVSDKIEFGRDRVVDLTGNPNFPTPNPTLATITTVTDDLETKNLAALGGGPAQTAARDAAELIWNDTLDKEAAYVELTADGDVTKITSAGFHPTKTESSPKQIPAKPGNLIFKRSEETGVVFFSCDVVPDAEGYVAILSADASALDISTSGTQLIIELTAATPAPFAAPPPPPATTVLLIIDVSSQRKKTIRGLTPATRIHGKMYCINSAGRGPDSDVISIMVA
jgi:hypothetical protein